MKLQEEMTTLPSKTEGNKIMKAIRDYGPGIILVLTMMGAGDLVTASVSGSLYGYNLMWILVGALLIRYVITNVMARYQIMNNKNMTILDGYTQIHKIFPMFFIVSAFVLGHLTIANMIKGSGLALSWMFGIGDPFLWSIFVVVVSLGIMIGKAYRNVEVVMKILLAILTVCFIGLALLSKPSLGSLIKGTVGLGWPEGESVFSVYLVAIALIGTVAGSITNLMYPYVLQDKGWILPEHKRIQRNDLIFSFTATIVISLSIWIVGAEILRPRGIEVSELSDLAEALNIYMGSFGAWIFYLGVFGILFSSVFGTAHGYGKIINDCFYKIKGKVIKKDYNFDNDRVFKWSAFILIISPLFWSFPGMIGFVELVLFSAALQIVSLPMIAGGLLYITNKKSDLGKHINNWFENLIIFLAFLLSLWGSYQLLMDFIS